MASVPSDIPAIRSALLGWYDVHGRSLPWRAGPDEPVPSDPYRVWLSEVMLQQTTVPHATPYFLSFLQRWPTVGALAAAPDAEVMAAWAGLGYYARARNLMACARAVSADHGGVFPDTEAALLALPGVGAYTAAAVAAITFDRPANVVDGNVERVMARLFAVEIPLPAAKPGLKRLAAGLIADDRPGDWAQALMDLGATVCRSRTPLCDVCPLTAHCAGFAVGSPERYPLKTARAERPRRFGTAFVLVDDLGRIALVQRPARGLLGGMLGLPTTDWGAPDAAMVPPVAADWRSVGTITHVFTHFALTLAVQTATGQGDFIWTAPERALADLPTVFRKALNLVVSDTGPASDARARA